MLDVKPVVAKRLGDYARDYNDTLRKMIRNTFVYVEGPSDTRFYKGLMDGNLALHFVDGRLCIDKKGKKYKKGGCDFVLKAFGEYSKEGKTQETRASKENVQDCIFCIDRDFRAQLNIPPETDSTEKLFYQLCTGKYGEGFNDLECVLVSLPMYETVLEKRYKIPAEVAKEMLDHAIHVAAILGCYRMGNRVAKGADMQRNIFWQDNSQDRIDTDGRGFGKELGVHYLLQCGAANVVNGLVELNEEALQRSLNYMSGQKNKIKLALDKAQEFKIMMRSGRKLDYCRGHDITYLLCVELRDMLNDFTMTVKSVEDSLAELMNRRDITQHCRSILAGYGFVKKLEEIVS